MAIPYHIAKFNPANYFAIAILGSTAKFNSCQYFLLCGSKGLGSYMYISYSNLRHKNVLCSYIAICMYVLSILLQEVVEEPATDGDSDHTDSGGSVVDSMEACE